MTEGRPSPTRRPKKAGAVERYKAFRDRFRLKPLLVAILYLIVPILTFQLIMLQYPGLDPARFHRATVYIVPTALALIAVAFAQEERPKGRMARLVLDVLYVALSLVWMIAIIGGNPVIRSEYESHPFSIDVSPLIAIGVFTAMMNFAHDVMEYYYYRTPGVGAGTAIPSGTEGARGLMARQEPDGPVSPAVVPAIIVVRPSSLVASFSIEIGDWRPEALPARGTVANPGAPGEEMLSITVEGGRAALPPVPEATGRRGNVEAGFDAMELTPDLHRNSTQS